VLPNCVANACRKEDHDGEAVRIMPGEA
jgi:hypothetical protein